MQLRALGAATAVVVLVVACGGDGGEVLGGGTIDADSPAGERADAEAYVEAVAEAMLDDDEEPWFDEGSATCTAVAIVDLLDAGALDEARISPEDVVAADSLGDIGVELPDDAASELAEGVAACGMAEPMQEALVEELGAAAGGELSSGAITCLEEVIDDQSVGEAVAAALIDGSDEGRNALAIDALAGCPGVMTAIVVGGGSNPVAPQDEACIHDVIEANPDLIESAILDEDSTAGQKLGASIAVACPNYTG